MASQRVRTNRANSAKTDQEEAVRNHLADSGLAEVETREIWTPADAPRRGEFCAECSVAGRKADVVVGLHDGRVMPIECKVSNSSTNSVKRLNNDAAAKAAEWLRAFGHQGIVPTAVLSGVFKTHNLVQAQDSGLTIFWAHDLAPLTAFVSFTE